MPDNHFTFISSAFILILTTVFASLAQEVKYTNICFNSTQESQLDLVCNGSEKIEVLDSYYYKNEWGACFFKKGDCKEKEEKVISLCNDRRTCYLKIKRIYSLSCGYVSLLRVVYQCKQNALPVDDNGQLGVVTSRPEKDELEQNIPENSQSEWEDEFRKEVEESARAQQEEMIEKSKQISDNKVMILAAASAAGIVGFISVIIIIVMIIKNCQYSERDENANSILDAKTANCLKSFLLKQKVISVRECPVGTEHPSPIRQKGKEEKVLLRNEKDIFERGVEGRDIEAQHGYTSEDRHSLTTTDRAFAVAAHLSEIVGNCLESDNKTRETCVVDPVSDLRQLSPASDDDNLEFNVVLQPLDDGAEAEENDANDKEINCCDVDTDDECTKIDDVGNKQISSHGDED